MRIVGFAADSGLRLGVVDGDQVIDLQAADNRLPADLGEWLAARGGDVKPLGDIARRASASARRPLANLKFSLPVARPGKIVCLGLNYLEHAREGGHDKPQYPSIFMRCLTSLVPHLEPIIRPAASETLDYEAEFVAIIGKPVRHARLADALDCVAGYSCFNDGSIRQFQRRTSQWDMGKNFDRTGAFGPWLVSADELPAGARGLKIESRLNGKVLQSDNTANMMYPVAETIVDLTQGMTLEPGDIIVTGTPSGVGHARKPPLWMRPHDVCEIEIQGVGVLRNPIADEALGIGQAAAE